MAIETTTTTVFTDKEMVTALIGGCGLTAGHEYQIRKLVMTEDTEGIRSMAIVQDENQQLHRVHSAHLTFALETLNNN